MLAKYKQIVDDFLAEKKAAPPEPIEVQLQRSLDKVRRAHFRKSSPPITTSLIQRCQSQLLLQNSTAPLLSIGKENQYYDL